MKGSGEEGFELGKNFAENMKQGIAESDFVDFMSKLTETMKITLRLPASAYSEIIDTAQWERLFASLDKIAYKSGYSVSRKLKDMAKEAKESGKMTEEEFTKINEVIDTQFKAISGKNPLATATGKIGDSFSKMFTKGSGFGKKDLEQLGSGISEFSTQIFGDKGQTASSINGMITALGGNGEDVTRIMGGVNDTLTGTADVVSGIATMNPAKVIGGIAKAVTGIINIFGKDAGIEKKIKKIQKEIDELTKSSKELERQEKKLYGQQKSDKIGEEIANVAKQKELVEQQKELEESKKKTDKKQVESYKNAITDLEYKLEDLRDQQIAAAIGKDLSNMINDFSTAYANAWTAGNDKAAALKDVVKKSIQTAAIQLVKTNISGKVKEFTEALAKAMENGVLDSGEEAMLDRLQQEILEKSKIDESFNKYFEPAEATRTAASKGITSMTQDTAEELNGRFAAIQEHTASIKDSVISLAKNGEEMLKTLFGIEQNTSRLAAIENNMVAMRNGIDYINMKGVRLI